MKDFVSKPYNTGLKVITNPSKLGIYLCKIPTVITETLIV